MLSSKLRCATWKMQAGAKPAPTTAFQLSPSQASKVETWTFGLGKHDLSGKIDEARANQGFERCMSASPASTSFLIKTLQLWHFALCDRVSPGRRSLRSVIPSGSILYSRFIAFVRLGPIPCPNPSLTYSSSCGAGCSLHENVLRPVCVVYPLLIPRVGWFGFRVTQQWQASGASLLGPRAWFPSLRRWLPLVERRIVTKAALSAVGPGAAIGPPLAMVTQACL